MNYENYRWNCTSHMLYHMQSPKEGAKKLPKILALCEPLKTGERDFCKRERPPYWPNRSHADDHSYWRTSKEKVQEIVASQWSIGVWSESYSKKSLSSAWNFTLNGQQNSKLGELKTVEKDIPWQPRRLDLVLNDFWSSGYVRDNAYRNPKHFMSSQSKS